MRSRLSSLSSVPGFLFSTVNEVTFHCLVVCGEPPCHGIMPEGVTRNFSLEGGWKVAITRVKLNRLLNPSI